MKPKRRGVRSGKWKQREIEPVKRSHHKKKPPVKAAKPPAGQTELSDAELDKRAVEWLKAKGAHA